MLLFLPCILVVAVYIVSGVELEFDSFLSLRPYNPEDGEYTRPYNSPPRLVFSSVSNAFHPNDLELSPEANSFLENHRFSNYNTQCPSIKI